MLLVHGILLSARIRFGHLGSLDLLGELGIERLGEFLHVFLVHGIVLGDAPLMHIAGLFCRCKLLGGVIQHVQYKYLHLVLQRRERLGHPLGILRMLRLHVQGAGILLGNVLFLQGVLFLHCGQFLGGFCHAGNRLLHLRMGAPQPFHPMLLVHAFDVVYNFVPKFIHQKVEIPGLNLWCCKFDKLRAVS